MLAITLKPFALKTEQFAIPLVVLLCSLLAFLFDSQIADNLIYQRAAIEQGQYWRLFTAHLFHTNAYHLLLNLAALVLLWSLHGHFYKSTTYLSVFIVSSLLSALGVHYFSLDINQYVGLSGTLHGIFIWGAMLDIIHKDKTGYLLFIGGWLKIAHEQFFGASTDVSQLIDAQVAIDAHLFGALGGVIIGGIALYRACSKVNDNYSAPNKIS